MLSKIWIPNYWGAIEKCKILLVIEILDIGTLRILGAPIFCSPTVWLLHLESGAIFFYKMTSTVVRYSRPCKLCDQGCRVSDQGNRVSEWSGVPNVKINILSAWLDEKVLFLVLPNPNFNKLLRYRPKKQRLITSEISNNYRLQVIWKSGVKI